MTALVGVVGLSNAAHANASISATCGFEAIVQTDRPVPLQGGSSGTYGMGDLITSCEGTVDGVQDAFVAAIQADGTYASQFCTTATFASTSSSGRILQSIAGNGGRTFVLPNQMNVATGFGQIWFLSPAHGIGTFEMIPRGATQALPSACATGFDVVGQFSLTTP